MAEGTSPIASNTTEQLLADAVRRLSALERAGAGAGFLTGDYCMSEKTHADMTTTTLSDGGRAGWYLANGATNATMSTDAPELYEYLGSSNVLPDYKGRVMVAPNGATFAARGTTVGAESGAVSGTTDNESAHTHAPGSYTVTTASLVTAPGPPGGVPGSGTTAVAGTSAAGSAHNHGFSSTASALQPTRACGTVWIKR